MADPVETRSTDGAASAAENRVAISATDLSKRFGETTAVDDVSFAIESGTIAAFMPAIVVAVVGFVAYTLVVDVLTYGQFGRLLLPNTPWLVLLLSLVPAVSTFSLGVTVLASMEARGFEEAQQIAGVVLLPVVALLLARVTGVLLLSPGLLLGLDAVVFVLDAVLILAGTRAFEPEALLTSS